MRRPTEDNTAGFRFYDATTENSATERSYRLAALEQEPGFENLRNEFSYQVHLHLDRVILDPSIMPHERQVLVEARQVLMTCLEPSILVERGQKRAQAEMQRAGEEALRRGGI